MGDGFSGIHIKLQICRDWTVRIIVLVLFLALVRHQLYDWKNALAILWTELIKCE